MGKALKSKRLHKQPAHRALLAVSLAASLAAFGCTTNRTLGNGDPTDAGSGVRTPPTAGVTSGSEAGSTVPPSMTSSYRGTSSHVVQYVRANHVAEYMARIEATPPVRILGASDPGAAPPPSASALQVTGQFVNPALIANPQLTINSSASSAPVPAIVSGAGGAGAGVAAGAAVDAAGFVAGVVDSGLVAGGNAAPVFTPSGVPATPTSAALPLPAGAFISGTSVAGTPAAVSPAPAGTLATPTTLSAINPPLTAVSGGTFALPPMTSASSGVRLDPARVAAASRISPSASAGIAPVRVRSSNGRVVVTNVE